MTEAKNKATKKKASTTKKAPAKKKASKKKATKKNATKKNATGAVTVPNKQSVSGFIASIENDQRRKDAKTILALMKKVTGDKAVMWGPSIIGFGKYRYKYESGREGEMLLVGFSPRKANMVLYILGALGDDDPLLAKLGKFKRGKSCLYINKLEDIDMGVLQKLIRKSYDTTKKKWKAL